MNVFDWDEENLAHIALHGVSAKEAEEIVLGDAVELVTQERNGELRHLLLGETFDGRILKVVVTMRTGADGVERVRVVTAWDGGRRGRENWEALKA